MSSPSQKGAEQVVMHLPLEIIGAERVQAHRNQGREYQRTVIYFDRIFGCIMTSGIDVFAQKYKCWDEEKHDDLKEFTQAKGNLVKMQDFVTLAGPGDAQ